MILRKKEGARSLDVDHFHDMIRTAQDHDQILKVLNSSSVVREISRRYAHQILEVPSNQLSHWQAIIALHQVFFVEIVCL